jgi:hypothetical protein
LSSKWLSRRCRSIPRSWRCCPFESCGGGGCGPLPLLGAVHCPYVPGGCGLDQRQAARPPAGQAQHNRAQGLRRRPRPAGSGRRFPRGTDRRCFLLAQGRLQACPSSHNRSECSCLQITRV